MSESAKVFLCYLAIWFVGCCLMFGGYIVGYNDGEWNACIRVTGKVCPEKRP